MAVGIADEDDIDRVGRKMGRPLFALDFNIEQDATFRVFNAATANRERLSA